QKSLLRADRAIAFRGAIEIGGDAEAHRAAMAAALHHVLHWFMQRLQPVRAKGREGLGTSCFHSLADSIQEAMASCTFFSASSGVAPSDMQPGGSGTVTR